jgi:uncharacterized membrane protein
MNEYVMARLLHVLAVVLWIGGIAMVTTVILPAVRRISVPEDRISTFEAIEHRFSWQARVTTLVTGLSGFYMIYLIDGWHRFSEPAYWWMHAMVAVWVIFTLILFVFEPFLLRRVFQRAAAQQPDATFTFLQWIHWILLTLSIITTAGAVAGSHGWSIF